MRYTPLLFAATTTLAAPLLNTATPNTVSDTLLLPRGGPISFNESNCKGYVDVFWNVNTAAYKVTIGRPYLGGSRCPTIKTLIADKVSIETLKCSGEDNNSKTILTITADRSEKNLKNINAALSNAYPEIKFHCPTKVNK